MKKVLLINQSTGYLMVDIVNAYKERYNDVVLIAGSIKVAERAVNSGISIDKIIAYDRRSAFRRAFTWIVATFQILFKLIFKYKDYDIVYVTNPPMSYFISLFIRRPFSVIVYDVYPDGLKDIGITSRNLFYKIWAYLNKKCLKKATCVFTLSKGMEELLKQYVNIKKIKIIPVWAASEGFCKVDKVINPFVKKYSLDNKFIVLYSGNIGYSHDVEPLLEVANYLKEEKDICFLIVGEGKKKKIVQDKVKEYGLSSCLFLTWQNATVFPYLLSAADVGVVSINEEAAKVSVPSKTFNLLAAGLPLLCIAPHTSELSSIIDRFKNGKCFDKCEVNEMADYILDLKNNSDFRHKLSEESLVASKQFTFKLAKEFVL